MKKKSPVVVAVAQNIRKIRESKHYSQEEFADHIGLDRKNYGAIERGERNISITTLMRIVKGLEVEVWELFPSLKELIKLLKSQGNSSHDN